jgi:hypothetical protein
LGDDQEGVTGQAEEGALLRGRDDLESVQRGREAVPSGGEPSSGGARTIREPAQLIQDGLEPLWVVTVLRALDGSEDVLVGLGARAGGAGAGGCVVRGHGRRGPAIALPVSQDALAGHVLAAQVLDSVRRPVAVQDGQDAGDAAAEFLRHDPIVGATIRPTWVWRGCPQMPFRVPAEGGGRVAENTGEFGVGVQAAVKETDAPVEHSNNFGKLHNLDHMSTTTAGSWHVEARVLSQTSDFRY